MQNFLSTISRTYYLEVAVYELIFDLKSFYIIVSRNCQIVRLINMRYIFTFKCAYKLLC